jgi:DNA-binding beta-propeller fold protein YncE
MKRAIVAAAMLICAERAWGSFLYTMDVGLGTSPGGTLYTVDQTNGQTTPVWTVPARTVTDMASDWRPASPRLWVGDFATERLYVVTPTAVALVGTMDAAIRTIAFDPKSERMFGVARDGTLYRISTETAATTAVGPLRWNNSLIFPGSLAFDLDGTLWGADSQSNRIFTIDPSSASATLFKTIPGLSMTDIAFRPEDGALFGISNIAAQTVYRINLAAGTVTPLSSAPGEIGGAAFLPVLVPEPTSATALLLLAAHACARRRRVRS